MAIQVGQRQTANPAAIALCAVVGAVGVLNGFALFFLLEHEFATGKGHGAIVVLALCLSALLAYLIEMLRHWVTHPHGSLPSLSEVANTFVAIALSELLIAAAHEWDANARAFFTAPCKDLSPASVDWMAKLIAVEPKIGFRLGMNAVAWVAIGALISARLGHVILRAPEEARDSIRFGASVGAKAGFILAPLAMVICILILRLIDNMHTATGDPQEWARYMSGWRAAGANISSIDRLLSVDIPVYALNILAVTVQTVGVAATALVYAVVLVTAFIAKWRGGYAWPFYIIAGLGLFYLALPEIEIEVVAGEQALILALRAAVLAALVWGIPATLLGGLVPLWRRFHRDRRWWTAVAFLIAAALMAVTALRLFQPESLSATSMWLLMALGGLSLVAGFVFRKGDPFAEQWPFAALLVALVIGLVTSVSTSFVGVWVASNTLYATLDIRKSYWFGNEGCLGEFRDELLKAQFLPVVSKPEAIEKLQGKLKKKVEECDRLYGQGAVEVDKMLYCDFTSSCRSEEQSMLAAFDKYVPLAHAEAQCAAAHVPQWLEVSVAGAFGFWVTLGLLAAFRRYGDRSE